MSGWGIAPTASEIEKIKAESADYLNGLNSCGVIDWDTYNAAFDFYMNLLDKAYKQGKKDMKDAQSKCLIGKWKTHKDGSGTCTVCHFTQKAVWDMDRWQEYCGHCGAKMEGIE